VPHIKPRIMPGKSQGMAEDTILYQNLSRGTEKDKQ
jgi:hypothetical protein